MSANKHTYESRFSRNIGIYTNEMQDLLRKSTVVIGGVGGVGGIIAVTLARNGIGHLKIADPDVFEEHNINRQYGALVGTLGRHKIEVMKDILKDVNPDMTLDTYPGGVKKENIEDFLEGADVVIDAIEYSAPEDKLALYQEARKLNLYVLSSPISGFGTLMFCFDPKGVTVEEIFKYPKDSQSLSNHKIPPEILIGRELDYVPKTYLEDLKTGRHFASNGASCALAAAATSIYVLKILLLREKEKNPQTKVCLHLENIPLIVVPHAIRYDLWESQHSEILDLRKIKV